MEKAYPYAQLPPYKYQTFDRFTLQFSDVPVIPLFANPPPVDDSKANADEETKDEVAAQATGPEEHPPAAVSSGMFSSSLCPKYFTSVVDCPLSMENGNIYRW
jgi:hypothetical protein